MLAKIARKFVSNKNKTYVCMRKRIVGFEIESHRKKALNLDLRFGLTGNGTHSLRQIGHLLRISKERVRQIQNRALEKLRASAERVGWEPSLLLG